MKRLVAALLLTTLALTACGSDSEGQVAVTPSPTETPSEEPSPTPSEEPSPSLDPEPAELSYTDRDFLDALEEAGMPTGFTLTYNRRSDPNELLGRPGGYVMKSEWQDTRTSDPEDYSCATRDDFEIQGYDCGGTIEIFRDPEDAQARFVYLKVFASTESVGGIPVGGFYMWLTRYAVVRVGNTLLRHQANEYDDFFQEFFEGEPIRRYRGQ